MTERKNLTPEETNMLPSLDFETLTEEPWVTVKLENGTVLKVKTNIMIIKKMPYKDPDGSDVYFIGAKSIARIAQKGKEKESLKKFK